MEKLFVVCAPGVEPFTALELRQLNLINSQWRYQSVTSLKTTGAQYEFGGIEFEGSLHDLYRANFYLRTASRVLVRLGEFYASTFPELRRKASRLVWAQTCRRDWMQPSTKW